MKIKINNTLIHEAPVVYESSHAPEFSFYNPFNYFNGNVKEWAREQSHDFVLGVVQGIGDLLFDLSHAIALIGGGICIIMWVAGWKDGARYASMLVVGSILIRFLLG